VHLLSATLHPERYPDPGAYPFRLPLLRETRRVEFPTPVTFFVGENGSGKSTLLEALARRCGIHIWRDESRPRVEHNRWEARLHEYLEVAWAAGPVPGSFFGADSFRGLAQLVDEWAATDPGQLKYFGGASLLTKSHGQSLMAFFRSQYRLRGLFLLDEPEAALSPRTQLELLGLLDRMGREGRAQFVVATHSPILMACPGATIYGFDVPPLRPVRYEETAHFRLYREFLADPAGHLARLPG
jgi:predicted ATPase